MSEEIQLPPLPDGMRWEKGEPDDESLYVRCSYGYTVAIAGDDCRVLIWTWKNQGKFIPYLGAKTQQEALNHAAALLFLGEGDE